jgi:hypothetical protein
VVRVTAVVDRDDDPNGRPIVHTFLARIAAPRQREEVALEIKSFFMDPRDEPGGQTLPRVTP